MELLFERSGKTREVVETRDDSWPICPSCDEDELACVGSTPAAPNAIDLCYRCGPVKVVDPLFLELGEDSLFRNGWATRNRRKQLPAGTGREEG